MFNLLSRDEQNEVRLYGVTVAGMKEAVECRLARGHYRNAAMFVYALIQTAQEEVLGDALDDAHQTLNRAKWVQSNYVA